MRLPSVATFLPLLGIVFIQCHVLAFLPSSYRLPNYCRPKSKALNLHDSCDGNKSLEAQREDYRLILEQIDFLKRSIEQSNSTAELENQTIQVKQMEKQLSQLVNQLIPPEGLSMEEYLSAIRVMLTLSPQFRLALVKSVEMDDNAARDVQRIPEIITKLYEEQNILTPYRLSKALKAVMTTNVPDKTTKVSRELSDDKMSVKLFSDFFDSKESSEIRSETNVKTFYSRATRKVGTTPTANDLEILMDSLDKSTFIPTAVHRQC